LFSNLFFNKKCKWSWQQQLCSHGYVVYFLSWMLEEKFEDFKTDEDCGEREGQQDSNEKNS
jgi:hypothetical protein